MNKTTMIATLALVAGLGGGYWLARHDNAGDDTAGQRVEQTRKVLYYRNPMNPAITSPVPAQDEMGMDYIAVYADDRDGAEPAGTVSIDPVTVQNIGVRAAPAERRTLARTIRAMARVAYDEERMTRLHPKTEGWIEKLNVDKTGQMVTRDTILLSIYSPQLVAGQQEYLLALDNWETLKNSPFDDIRKGAEALVESSLERLELLDVPRHQLRDLQQTHKIRKSLHIHSPFDGVVVNLGVRDGQYVTPKTQLYMLADLTKVWAYVDVYEYELPWIAVGDEALMQVAAVPGRSFIGKVGYIYPYLESKTRTVRLRLEFDNPEGLLKPDMFANVTLHASRQIDAVVVPREAVVRSGSREQVFVVRGPGKFEPREVTVGLSADGMSQIIEGVAPGDVVVTSAQFLIDSESKLREATAKMMESTFPGDSMAPDMDMDGMSVDDMSMDGMSMDGMSVNDMSMDGMNTDMPQPGREQPL